MKVSFQLVNLVHGSSTYRRTLGNIGPCRGLASCNRASCSNRSCCCLARGDSDGRQHVEQWEGVSNWKCVAQRERIKSSSVKLTPNDSIWLWAVYRGRAGAGFFSDNYFSAFDHLGTSNLVTSGLSFILIHFSFASKIHSILSSCEEIPQKVGWIFTRTQTGWCHDAEAKVAKRAWTAVEPDREAL